MGLLRGIERLSILLFLGFRYRVCFLLYAVAGNFSLLRLFVRIMYLRGIIVLFSYSFILSDVKVRFRANPLNVVISARLIVFLALDGNRVSVRTDVIEVY